VVFATLKLLENRFDASAGAVEQRREVMERWAAFRYRQPLNLKSPVNNISPI
jgi:hypothetical protein